MKKDMPLEGLRWSRDSGSALYDTPPNGRSRTGWGGDITKEETIRKANVWRALTELDAKAREAEELNKKLNKS